jgi:hypothetical protein
MGVKYANSQIVTNGLVLALDAADRNSYSGSGTSWTDLSGNGNNGTLTNGPTYSSANGGSIVFDGVDDYVDTNYIQPTSNFSISIVYKCTNFTPWSALWASEIWNNSTGYLAYFGTSTSLVLSRGGGSSISCTANSAALNSYTFTVSSDTAAKIYVNGVLQISSNIILASSVTKTLLLSTRHSNDGTGFTDRKASVIPHFSVYNRVLTEQEVLQNYNAQKARFNLN